MFWGNGAKVVFLPLADGYTTCRQVFPKTGTGRAGLMKLIRVYTVGFQPLSTSSTIINHVQDLAARRLSDIVRSRLNLPNSLQINALQQFQPISNC
jgi:hypothetical protein